MSKFFSKKYSELKPYTPGEQPQDMKYVKLNTNESPFSPSPKVLSAVEREVQNLKLYSDPECKMLRQKLADILSVPPSYVILSNGSDEILNFAFMAFSDESKPMIFPDITYGFYAVFAKLNSIPYEQVPLLEDFTIDVSDYVGKSKNIVIANPNAPTGISIELDEIEKIVKSNPENIVIMDEAYVDFGAESAIPLTKKYNNLIVVGTFSKSRSMAGARLGFAVANPELIRDLDTIRYSTNPYNVNRMTLAAGIATLEDNDYYMDNCLKIIETREYTKRKLLELGFSVLESKTNFLFIKSDKISGEKLYLKLKENGVLVRHFGMERIKNYNRVTIGTKEEMDAFLSKTESIIREM